MTFEQATTRPFSFTQRLRDIDMFFQGKDPVHQTMRRVARRLERVGIPYAVVGGMAVNAHRYRRTTGDVDLLLTEEGFNDFCGRFVGKNYSRVPDRPFRLVDRTPRSLLTFSSRACFRAVATRGRLLIRTPTT